MTTLSIEEAQANFSEVIQHLAPGDEVIITKDDLAVARIVASPTTSLLTQRQAGTLRGTVLHMADDFDAPLDDFREYME